MMRPQPSERAIRRSTVFPVAALFIIVIVLALLAPLAAQTPPPAPAAQQNPSAPNGSSVSDSSKNADAGQKAPEAAPAEKKPAETSAEKEEQEENANLTHAKPIRWLAGQIGLSVHGAHLLLSIINFAIVALVIAWAVRKNVPGMLRKRSQSIQQALEQARTASQDANRRLADIESRLRQMDAEIAAMQSAAVTEAEGEESRIKDAAQEEIQKIVQAAEQEIASAAKLARRELSAHTADLAVALARRQINVDAGADQVLVRNFASKLAGAPAKDAGKDGR